MTRGSLFLALAIIVAPATASAQEAVKVGFVDLQRAIPETEEGRKAKASLKKIFDQKQKEIDERQEAVRKAGEDLQKKRTLLPAETVRQKEVELGEQVQQIQQTYLRHQQDLQQKEQEAMQKIVERMQRIIGKIASAENLTMVVEKSALVFAKPHLDLTNELIRRYNAGEGAAGPAAGGPSTPAAPAPAKAPAAKK